MLQLPSEYTAALQEVLSQDLSPAAMRTKEGHRFIARIAESVAKLSLGLTRERERFAGANYLSDRPALDAYRLYYTTNNLLKIWPPLRELARSRFFTGRTKVKMLDIGTGLGAALWGTASYLQREQPTITQLDIHATDAHPEVLRPLEQFAGHFARHIAPLSLQLRTGVLDLASQSASTVEGEYDLITMMNVVNELDEMHDNHVIEQLQRLLAPDGAIIIVEPASREESRRTLRLRERLIASGLNVYSPCTHDQMCPALLRPDDWCHTELTWERPEFIRAIDDIVGTLRLSLKSTYLVVRRAAQNLSMTFQLSPPDAAPGRVVSERFDEKGRVRMFVCSSAGRREFVMNKRDRAPANRRAMEVERYELIMSANVEERPHDVKIGGTSIFHTLLLADGCEIVDK